MGLAHEQTDEQWMTMLDVNLAGAWRTAKAAIPTLIEQGTGGSIALISSVGGLKTWPGNSSYNAAKFGLTGLTQSLAKELASHRVRVNSIHPTNVRTDMADNPGVHAAFRPDLENPTFEDVVPVYAEMNLWPMPFVETRDISNAVLWLASDAARYITGVALPVDLGASIV
jgi:(+)-trans-carveol dehydrogenase